MRIRFLLLLPGLFLWLFQSMGIVPAPELQLVIFFTGLLLLGVPHGAADLLVAGGVSKGMGGNFKAASFFRGYLSRLLLFGLLLWWAPWAGLGLFLLISAFHFGETDLARFDISDLWGRNFVVSYGMSILGMLLFTHLDEVRPLLAFAGLGPVTTSVVDFIARHTGLVLTGLACYLVVSGILFFSCHPSARHKIDGRDLLVLLIILLLLWRLPLLMGFTFYFIGWHSVLSMRSIMRYLVRINGISSTRVWRQMAFYSLLAVVGTLIIGASGFMFADTQALLWYSFMSLAVLTAPHMQVMHDMYHMLRRG